MQMTNISMDAPNAPTLNASDAYFGFEGLQNRIKCKISVLFRLLLFLLGMYDAISLGGHSYKDVETSLNYNVGCNGDQWTVNLVVNFPC